MMIPILWILLAIHFFDLSYAFFKFNPFVPTSYMYPDHTVSDYLKSQKKPMRFWGYGTAAIDANIPIYWRDILQTDMIPCTPNGMANLSALPKTADFFVRLEIIIALMRPLHPDLARLTFKTIPTENKFFVHLVFPLSLIDKKTARVKKHSRPIIIHSLPFQIGVYLPILTHHQLLG